MDWLRALIKLDLPVGRLLNRAGRSDGLRRPEHGAALDGRVIGVLDGAQPSGNPGLTGGDGLAVAPTIGAFGQVGAVLFDFADVGFAFIGVRGEGDTAMLALAVSRTRVTVPVSGSWRARAVIRGPSVSGHADSGALPPCRARA